MVKIQGYDFEGPWQLGQEFNNVAGVYVLYTNQKWLDVGQTDALGDRLNGDNHERKPDWIRNAENYPIWIAFLKVPNEQTRLQIESQLRLTLQPCCGDR